MDRVVQVGTMPSDNDGPHNLAVAPDGKSYYVSIAHGTPFGSLWKLDAADALRRSGADRALSRPRSP